MGSLRVQEARRRRLSDRLSRRQFRDAATGRTPACRSTRQRTLFHEFGHALHGLAVGCRLSEPGRHRGRTRLRRIPQQVHGTLDRQLPEMLTDARLPAPLIEAIGAGRRLRPGVRDGRASRVLVGRPRSASQSRNLADSARDRSCHAGRMRMPPTIAPRHGLAHFTHVFDGGYASAYYSYLWSEVLDADAIRPFRAGRHVRPRTRRTLPSRDLGVGDSRDPATSFIAFRGREPDRRVVCSGSADWPDRR